MPELESVSPPRPERLPFPPPFVLPTVALLVVVGAIWFGYRAWRQRTVAILQAACLEAVDAEDWPRVEQIALRWLEYQPGDADILIHLADAAKWQAAYDRTAGYLLRIPDADDRALTSLGLAAEIQMNELNRPFDAEQTWLRMLTLAPHANVPRRKVMYLYAMTLQRERLHAQVREALRTQSEAPDAYVYLMLLYELRFSDAYPKLSAWMRNAPTSETLQAAQALALAAAPQNLDAGVYDADGPRPGDHGPVLLRLREYPQNVELRAFVLGQAFDQGDAAAVERELQQAPPTAEQDPRFWRARAWLHRAGNRLSEAESAARTAVKLFPLDWRSWHELSQILRRAGQSAEAQRLATIAETGKQIERDAMALPDTASVSTELLLRIGTFARQVDDLQVADAISARVAPEGRPAAPPVGTGG